MNRWKKKKGRNVSCMKLGEKKKKYYKEFKQITREIKRKENKWENNWNKE